MSERYKNGHVEKVNSSSTELWQFLVKLSQGVNRHNPSLTLTSIAVSSSQTGWQTFNRLRICCTYLYAFFFNKKLWKDPTNVWNISVSCNFKSYFPATLEKWILSSHPSCISHTNGPIEPKNVRCGACSYFDVAYLCVKTGDIRILRSGILQKTLIQYWFLLGKNLGYSLRPT